MHRAFLICFVHFSEVQEGWNEKNYIIYMIDIIYNIY